ncbi:hypothetical protein MIND_00248800 [Mycena indigotica]|uniref:Uncharacterized protein n=1 Tax=Mycena indigotica TaxID=2126181 RepID=A0A8H6T9D8_9AGAR|nr:uncharacterized protein MIND_00248800 [Mycena indigotica]KAF7312357.1 hypothetical protein MIND_00248800 [Mycena indigotica]
MQFSSLLALTFAAVSVSAVPVRRGVDPALVIPFGVNAGTAPTGTGDCIGFNNVKIPCSCPPPFDEYLKSLSANVAAGRNVNNPGVPAPFPTDNSQQSRIIRLQTQITALQNLRGPGVGCPAAATNWNPIVRLASLIAGNPPPAPAAPAPAPPPPPPPAAAPPPPPPAPAAGGVNPAQVLEFGVARGAKFPAPAPPDRNDFIKALNENVAAGKQVRNPGIAAPFPTDGSVNSQIIRLQTQISTLQNLRGPGQGCPAAATNWNGILAGLIAQPH